MITLRKSEDRGEAHHGWLRSKHSFSFGDYYDKAFLGFGPLRVINEDRIEGGSGFSPHDHQDMEIISYVITGALQHQDSLNNTAIIRPGDVQRMSAGTGVRHSEYNVLKDQVTHFLQIWIKPEKKGMTPSYGQHSFSESLQRGDLTLVASKSGKEGSITLNQDVDISIQQASQSGERIFPTSLQRRYWIQLIQGTLQVEQTLLQSGDGAQIQKVNALNLSWQAGVHFILFDLP